MPGSKTGWNVRVAGLIGAPGDTAASAMNSVLVEATQIRTRSGPVSRFIATSSGWVESVTFQEVTLPQSAPVGLR